MRSIAVIIVFLAMFGPVYSKVLGGDQQSLSPEKIFVTFAEGMTAGPDYKGIKTGYRMWTLPVIKEMLTKIHINSMEVHPVKIEIRVGEVYSLKNLRVVARDEDGKIVANTPIALSYSQYVLCYDDCNQGWEEVEPRVIEIENRHDEANLIRGLRPGKTEIRIDSLIHRRDGTCPSILVDLTVQ
jgi:hypothetical protein